VNNLKNDTAGIKRKASTLSIFAGIALLSVPACAIGAFQAHGLWGIAWGAGAGLSAQLAVKWTTAASVYLGLTAVNIAVEQLAAERKVRR
jgi:hypothetical protein